MGQIPSKSKYREDAGSANFDETKATIGGSMSAPEIIAHLTHRGCIDMTRQMKKAKIRPSAAGKGGFSDVYYAELRKGPKVAVKCLHMEVVGGEEVQLKRAAHELYVWSQCNHPNILELLGVAMYRDQIAMVSPWMDYGNLTRYVTNNPKADRYSLCSQVADAVAHLKGLEMVHGDIKGANVLVSGEHIPKLTDFGGSVISHYSLNFTARGGPHSCTTLRWMAPEIFHGETKHTYEGDVYALGMTILEIFTGAAPYAGLIDYAVQGRLFGRKPPERPEEHIPTGDTCSDLLWNLIMSCWDQELQNRPLASQVRDRLKSIPEAQTSGPRPVNPLSSGELVPIIDALMSTDEILHHLRQHGCPDVTDQLDISSITYHPVAIGGSGEIYRGALRNGDSVAIKRLGAYASGANSGRLKRTAHELYVWSKCKHPNILELLGVAMYDDEIAMVSPWMENGNLQFYLLTHPEADRYSLCLQPAGAVVYLRDEKMVHGGIKGANFLLSSDIVLKLTGFGESFVNEYTLAFTATTAGPDISLRWAAPELIMEETKHTYESDVYALGMTILEIYTASVPFVGSPDMAVIRRIVDGQHPKRPAEHIPPGDKFSDGLWDLLTSCWNRNPQLRPDARQVRDTLKSLRAV